MPSHRARIVQFWFVTATLVALMVAGCDGSDSDQTADEGSARADQVAASTGIDADRQAPAAPIEGATSGGVVTAVSEWWVPELELDPTAAWQGAAVSILTGLVTRSLTQYVYDPKLDTMVLVPDIATDVGTPNDDFTEWIYTIRPGVRFEDGTEVTADDVAYGIKRSFDRSSFPEGPDYSNRHFLGGDTYGGPYTSGTDYAGIVVDGDTLTLTMAHPFPDMPYWAAFPAMGPIPDGRADPTKYGLHPLATGPCKIADYKPYDSLTLVRNQEWDPDTDPGRHDYPDEYRFTFGVNTVKTAAAIFTDTGIGPTSVRWYSPDAPDPTPAQVENSPDLITTGPDGCAVNFVALDYRTITDLRVRQAVGYAYPSTGVVNASSTLGRSILPPGFPGRVDYNPLSTQPGETDPEQSLGLLKEAGYEPGEFELIFTYNADDPENAARVALITTALEAGGFTVDARPSADGTTHEHQVDPDAPYNIRVGGGWCPDWPTGTSWLPPLVSSYNTAFNWAYFHEPAVDVEIKRIGTLPLEEQPAAWAALDELVETEYYPYIVTEYPESFMLHGSRIGGMNNDDRFGAPTWKDIHVVP